MKNFMTSTTQRWARHVELRNKQELTNSKAQIPPEQADSHLLVHLL
jgi:hypothetical protein